MFFSGLWLSADENDRVAWSLTLSPQEPRVFGASCRLADGAPTTTTCRLLSGHFDATALSVRIVESSACDANATTIEYAGQVEHQNGSGVLLVLNVAGTTRRVVMRMEDRNAALHHSGAWCGAASPAAELAPFGIPTNPCFWSLSVVTAARVVFGAGYFDDAGDVPGRPLLRFLLAGTVAEDGRVVFRKVYEPSVVDAPVVHYEARIVVSSAETRLEGTWRNEEVFGALGARLEHQPHCSPHMALCADCGALLPPGRPRWTCVEPTCDAFLCTHCRKLDADCSAVTHAPGHRIVPSFTVQMQPMSAVHSVAELVHAALRLHAPRVFLRWGLENSSLSSSSLTYAAAGALVARVAATLFERDAALRGNLKRARPLCLVVTNQSAMANIVLLGVALTGYTVAHASASLSTDTLSVLIDLLKPSAIVRSRDSSLSTGLVFDADPSLVSDPQSLNSLIARSTVTLDDITPDRLPSASVAVVLFTSGSSGVPKAARFSETLALPAAVESTVQPCVRLDFAPFDPSHLLSLLSTLTVGGLRAIGPLDVAYKARPTVMGAPPSVWAQLARRIDVAVANVASTTARRRAADIVRAELGNRLTVATSGGAALDSHVADVIKRDLRVSLVELYATRETGGVARDGIVYPGVVVKLLPTEATASSTLLASSDVGQICVHSPRLIDGYVGGGNDDQFVELDGKRFYRTGDIGEFVTDDTGVRRLRVIGRATEHRKRADGTWFALPSRIEALLEQCSGVSRACVIPLPSGVVGAVTLGVCNVDEARLRLRAAGVASQDVPTVFVTSDKPLAETPNGKLDRRAVQAQFEAQLCAAPLASAAASAVAVSERLATLVRAAVHLGSDVVLDGAATLYAIGGDSLAAARLSQQLSIGVPMLLQLTLREIDVMMERGVSLSSTVATRSDDVLRDAQLPVALLEKLRRHAPQASAAAQRETHVVVTGAAGFCGDAIVRELRARSVAVIRLVRRADADDSAALVGDVRQSHFGVVDDEQYARLCALTTDVIHCAAQVDHLLPYAALRQTNVVGTLNVLDFAADCGGARLHLLSSIAALPAGDGADTERALAITQLQLQQKNGYGATKAVSELLVTAAARDAGLDVVVHRPGAVCASSDGALVPRNDIGVALVRACAALSARPGRAALQLCWTPVDAVARCVVGALLQRDAAPSLRVINLVASAAPTVDEVLVACERASQQQWRRLGVLQFGNELQRLDDAHPSAPLKALGMRWHDDNSLANSSLIECRAAAAVLGDDWRTTYAVTEPMLERMAPGLNSV